MDAVEVKPKPKSTPSPVVYVDAPLYETPPPKTVRSEGETGRLVNPFVNPDEPRLGNVDGAGTWHQPVDPTRPHVVPPGGIPEDFYIVTDEPKPESNNKIYKIKEVIPTRHETEDIFGGDIITQVTQEKVPAKDTPPFSSLPVNYGQTPHVWNPQTTPTEKSSTPTVKPTSGMTETEFFGSAHPNAPVVQHWKDNPPLDMGRREDETRVEAMARIQLGEDSPFAERGPDNLFLFDDVLAGAAISTGRQFKDTVMNWGLNDGKDTTTGSGTASTDDDKGFWWNFRNQPTAGKLAADAAKANNNDTLNILSNNNRRAPGRAWKPQEDISF